MLLRLQVLTHSRIIHASFQLKSTQSETERGAAILGDMNQRLELQKGLLVACPQCSP